MAGWTVVELELMATAAAPGVWARKGRSPSKTSTVPK
jgi:hypothetical protein